MKTNVIFLLLIFFLIVNLETQAQERIVKGSVINADTGEPLGNIKIKLKGTGFSTVSNAKGLFEISVPDSIKTIEFSNFQEMTVSEIKIIDANTYEIYLTAETSIFDLTLEELMEIEIVSATRSSQKLSTAPAIINVITAQQIKERGYNTVAEAIESLPGIDFIADHFQKNIGVRGVNGGMRAWSRIIKVMIDNQPVSYRVNSQNFLGEELIPISAIEKIEVIRGPGSAVYGANAYLGVINIITKKGEDVAGVDLSGVYKNAVSMSGLGTSGIIGAKMGDVDFVVSGTFSKFDRSGLSPQNVPGSTIYGYEESENDITKPLSVFSKIQYNNDKIGDIGVDFSYQLVDTYAEFQDWGVLTHNNRISFSNYYVRGKYAKSISENLHTNFSVSYSEGKPTENNQLDNDQDEANWISSDVGYTGIDAMADLIYNFKENNSFSVGIDYTSDNQNLQTYYLVEDGVEYANQNIENGEEVFANTGVYLQTSLKPVEKINFTAGLRYDMNSVYDDVLNYRLALVYEITDKTVTKLLYGTSYKAPTSSQLYTNYINIGGIIGNPDLKPEKAKTLEWIINLRPLKNTSFSLNTFYTIIQDQVSFVLPIGSVSNIIADNVSEIHSAGIEGEFLYKYNNLFTYLNLSYQRSIILRENLLKREVQVKTSLYPDFMAKFGVNYKLPSLFININLEGKYIGSRKASLANSYIYDPAYFRVSGYELDPYFIFDLHISTSNLKIIKDNVSVFSLGVENVLDANYAYPGFKNFDIPGFGRMFIVKISQEF